MTDRRIREKQFGRRREILRFHTSKQKDVNRHADKDIYRRRKEWRD